MGPDGPPPRRGHDPQALYGAFYDTPPHTMLRNLGRDTVIVTGTLTNYCCGTTARRHTNAATRCLRIGHHGHR
ncbi:hypothetical protein GCM10019016_062510 [Streptomyces prasinosporus]|uniref:Isochorismatase-like domain-containing protein n=1 Tax=Streptomyces prasinosporus TaxID=68256 RepID=A0ABP6TUY5_9ACTN